MSLTIPPLSPHFRRATGPIFLLAAVAFSFLPAGGERARAQDSVVDDDGIVERVENAGNALIKSNKTVKLRTLRTQLQHVHSCSLDLPAVATEELSPGELYARRARGVLVVGVLAKQKKRSAKYEMAGCSGFALTAEGIFVTNYHVVDNPEGETLVVMTHQGDVSPVTEVLAADKLADVAILRAPGAIFTPIPLAADAPPAGAAIWVISHPDHNFFSLTSGLVSRHFMADTEFGRTPQLAITADFGAGSSGGPVLDHHGAVGGMVCSTTSVYWEDEKIKDLQMVFKHCVPVESIRRLIEPLNPP